jgi:hypothetical protein
MPDNKGSKLQFLDYDYSDGKENFIDQFWINKMTGKKERIRIPKRPMRKSATISYHFFPLHTKLR